MLYHLSAHWLPGGFVGVDIFFVISGFVVGASLTHAPSDQLYRFVAFLLCPTAAAHRPGAGAGVADLGALRLLLFIPRAWLGRFGERTALCCVLGLSNWVL